ncbi:MAG: efflux transporter outer membrane subunit [Rikenellaceae bacterium]|nr:efflux transporter outer membrane subunit [Rikenellaceae bacterium]
MKSKAIYMAGAVLLLSSCNLYRHYQRPEVVTDVYREVPAQQTSSDTVNMGNLPWRDVFTDPKLQVLIERGLAYNADLQTARLKVEEAQAMLRSARLAYTPSLGLQPQGTISSFDNRNTAKTYQLPAVASWEIDLFGRLTNAKRKARADLMQSDAYRQAVQTQVIASIANMYYTLLMLDRQLAISEETSVIWRRNVETMRMLKERAAVNEAAVVQSEANSYALDASLFDLRRQIRETENSLSVLLGMAPQRIERGELPAQPIAAKLTAGVPLQLLSNRPDVKAAEMALAGTFYNTNAARAAFYPQITLNGTVGFSNSSGMGIVNPGKMILSAVGALTQPIFARGANQARLRVAKAQQQEATIAFQQSVLAAGAEVSDALFLYETARGKAADRSGQIASLEKAVEYTQELLNYSTATYLEVLTAQQALLSARLTEAGDVLESLQAVVNLYRALGGGREDVKPIN